MALFQSTPINIPSRAAFASGDFCIVIMSDGVCTLHLARSVLSVLLMEVLFVLDALEALSNAWTEGGFDQVHGADSLYTP